MATQTARDEVAGILHRMDNAFVANAKAGDARKLVEEFYSEDACLLPAHHDIVRGREAMVRLWRGVIAAGLKDLALVTTHIEVHGDMAYGIGQYHMTVEPPGGPKTEELGKCLVVYRKQETGAWKAVASMFGPNA